MYKRGSFEQCWSIDEIKKLGYTRHEEPLSGFNLESSEDEYRYQSIGASVHRGLPDCIDKSLIANNFYWIKDKVYAISMMAPGDVLPLHRDRYKVYIEKNSIKNINDVIRCIVFLDDRKPGHFLEINGTNISDWKAGDWVSWKGDSMHLACNLGIESRYTLQITGQIT